METVVNVLLTITTIVTMIAMFWLLAVPAGIVLSILKKLKKVNYTWKSILLWGFGGVGLFVIAFILYFLLNVIASFYGIPVQELTLPSQA